MASAEQRVFEYLTEIEKAAEDILTIKQQVSVAVSSASEIEIL